MMPQISPTKKLIAAFLLLLWASLVFGGWALGHADTAEAHRIPTWARMVSSFALVAMAWGWFAWFPDGIARKLSCGFAVGMTFGAIGDLALADLLVRPSLSIMLGIVLFAVGHGFYIRASYGFVNEAGLSKKSRAFIWVMWALVATSGWYIVVNFGVPGDETLRWASLVYSLILASTSAATTSLAVADRRFALMALGGSFFLLSDVFYAISVFNPILFSQIPDLVRGDIAWLTYGPAQALLIFSVPIALSHIPKR